MVCRSVDVQELWSLDIVPLNFFSTRIGRVQRSNIWNPNSTESRLCLFLSAVWIINDNIEPFRGGFIFLTSWKRKIKTALLAFAICFVFTKSHQGSQSPIQLCMRKLRSTFGRTFLSLFLTLLLFFCLFFFFPSRRWTADLSLWAAGGWKAELDSSVHICLSADKELYSATLNNFLGTEPVILRNLGQQHSMKSEYLPAWLNGTSTRPSGRWIEFSLTFCSFHWGVLFVWFWNKIK